MSVKMRQEVERKIATAVIDEVLKAGYMIDVYDGEFVVLQRGTQQAAILEKMFTTDEDMFFIRNKGDVSDHSTTDEVSYFGWVSFIYGNSGYDVVHDYTTNLESMMAEAKCIADHYGS